MLLEGQMPYVDFVDINPPLIIYVSALFAALATLLKMHPITTFLFSVWILSIVSALSTRKILQTAFGERDFDAAHILAIALSIAPVWLLTSRDMGFGEREHLFMLAFFPYLSTRFCRWEGPGCSRRMAVVVGLIAGIAASLKPHFLALVIAPELFWIITQRRIQPLLAPETITLSAAGLFYAAHFLLLPSEMSTAYFDRWVPMIVEGYRAWDKPLNYFLRDEILWVGPAVCATVLLLRSNSSAWYFAQTLSIVALVGLALFIGQGKGFSYHAILAQYALLGVTAILLAEALRGTRLSISTSGLNIALVAILVTATLVCSALLPRTLSGAPLAAIVSGSIFAQKSTAKPHPVMLFCSFPRRHGMPILSSHSSIDVLARDFFGFFKFQCSIKT